jgi:hypothetical protein
MKRGPTKGSREVEEHVEGEEVLDSDNSISTLSTLLNTINNEFEYECLDNADRQPNVHLIC